MPLSINHINYYIHPRGHRLQLQALNPGIERIEILTKGRGWILHENLDVEVKRGDVLWHQKGDSSIHRGDPEFPYECLNLVCQIDEDRPRPFPRINQWYDMDSLDRFCLLTAKDYKSGLLPKALFNTHTLTSIEYQITKSKVTERLSNFPSPLKRALNFIEGNFLSELNVKVVAKEAGLSITHLHELFRSHLKTSPHQYILNLRISQACQSLTLGNDPIKKIAIECGFSSDNSFCRSFRKYKHMTPDQFRKRYS